MRLDGQTEIPPSLISCVTGAKIVQPVIFITAKLPSNVVTRKIALSGDGRMSFEQWKKEAKRLVKLAIHKAGSQHAMSDSTGVDTSQLSRWGNEDDAVRHIPLYRAMELDEAAGDAIFKGWARWRGADLVFREHRQEVAENMLKLAASAAKAHGDFVATAHEAASDGVCTNLEERGINGKKQSHDEASDNLYGAVTRMKPN